MNTSTIKERPILFSGAMVRALLAGTKTQTRRICKDQPAEIIKTNFSTSGYADGANRIMVCPYGQPGERLWVRENFSKLEHGTTVYQADAGWIPGAIKWKPSIHMPRVASRILLEIVSVRVERLQDISEADAVAEGIHASPALGEPAYLDYINGGLVEPIKSYRSLWQKINGPDSWAANPWVWVVEFKLVGPE